MGLVFFHVVVAVLIALCLETFGAKKLSNRLSFTHGLSIWIKAITNLAIGVVIVTLLANLGAKSSAQGFMTLHGLFSSYELFAALVGLALLITPFAHFYGLGGLLLMTIKLSGLETTSGLTFGMLALTLSWTTLFLFAEFSALSGSSLLARFGITIRSSTLIVFSVIAFASCGLAFFDLPRLAEWMGSVLSIKASTGVAFFGLISLGVIWTFVALGFMTQILLPLAIIPTICLMAFSFGLSPVILILPFSMAMLLNLMPADHLGRIS